MASKSKDKVIISGQHGIDQPNRTSNAGNSRFAVTIGGAVNNGARALTRDFITGIQHDRRKEAETLLAQLRKTQADLAARTSRQGNFSNGNNEKIEVPNQRNTVPQSAPVGYTEKPIAGGKLKVNPVNKSDNLDSWAGLAKDYSQKALEDLQAAQQRYSAGEISWQELQQVSNQYDIAMANAAKLQGSAKRTKKAEEKAAEDRLADAHFKLMNGDITADDYMKVYSETTGEPYTPAEPNRYAETPLAVGKLNRTSILNAEVKKASVMGNQAAGSDGLGNGASAAEAEKQYYVDLANQRMSEYKDNDYSKQLADAERELREAEWNRDNISRALQTNEAGPNEYYAAEAAIEKAREKVAQLKELNGKQSKYASLGGNVELEGKSFAEIVEIGKQKLAANMDANGEYKSRTGLIGSFLDRAATNGTFGIPGAVAAKGAKRAMELADNEWRMPTDDWNEDQLDLYCYLLAIDPEIANEYAADTNDAKNQVRQNAERRAAQEYGNEHPVFSVLGQEANQLALTGLTDTADRWMEYGIRGRLTTRPELSPNLFYNEATAQVAQNLNDRFGTIDDDVAVFGGKGWGDVMQLGLSVVNSSLMAAVGGSMGGGGEFLTDLAFLGSAASEGIDYAKRNNAPDEKALLYGTIEGINEALFEHLSIENLINMKQPKVISDWVKNWLVQSGVEASEEVCTSVANLVADQIINGDLSEYNELYNQFYDHAANITDPKEREEYAREEAMKKLAGDLAFDAVGGFASGGLGAAGKMTTGAVAQQMDNSRVANQIIGNGYLGDLQATAANAGVDSSLIAATEGAEDRKWYNRLKANSAVAELYRETLKQQDSNASQQEAEALKTAAAPLLEERGVQNAEVVASAISKTITGDELSIEEKYSLESVDDATIAEIVNDPEVNAAVEAASMESMGPIMDTMEAGKTTDANKKLLQLAQEKARNTMEQMKNQRAAERAIVAEAAQDSGNAAMLEHYHSGQEAESYIRGWEAAAQFGANGIDQRYALSAAETRGLTKDQIIAAYEAGRSANNGEGNLRQGEKWNDRADTRRQAPRVEEGTVAEQTSGQQSQGGTVQNVAGEVTRPQIPNGVNNEHLVQVAEADYSEDERAAVAHAKKHGLECVIVRGDAIKTSVTVNGEKRLIRARAMIEGNTMWVRGDDPSFTAEQIANHEAGHKQIERGEVSIDETIKKLREKYTEKQLNDIIDLYAQAYGNSGLTAAEIMEEIVCDSLGQMNAFAVDSGSTVAGRVGMFLRSVNQAAKNSGQAQKTTAEGSGGVKFSIAKTKEMSWKDQIKKYRKGELKSSDSFYIGETPGVYGKEFAGPLVMNQKDYKKSAVVKHDVPNRVLKKLPALINDPIMAFIDGDRMAVVLDEIDAAGKQLVAALHAGEEMDRKPVTAITSTFGVDNWNAWIGNQAKKDIVIFDAKRADRILQTYGSNASVEDAIRSKEKVPQNGEKVKQQFSREVDVTQSPQFREWFGESKAVDTEGKPMVLYHQTDSDFTVFDPMHEGAGTRDQDTPFGIFLKSSDRNIGVRGEKQMPLYASIQKPLEVRNREDLMYQLRRMSDDYVMLTAEHEKLDREYKQKHEEAGKAITEYMTKWRKEHPEASRRALWDDAEFNKIYDAEDDILDEWETEARKLEKKSKEVITAALRKAGYDGVIIKEDKGSFGRSTDAYIALDPEQVKSATDNIGTFSKNSKDIRYSYVGEFAQGADKSALDQAREMEQQGSAAKDIRAETGWFKGKDGKWRFEISDKDMTVLPAEIPNYIKLGDLISHEQLFKQYPDMKDMQVYFANIGEVGGEYNRQFDDITISPQLKQNREKLLNVLTHELQHAIQSREGFTPGASVEYWQRRLDKGYDSRTRKQKEQASKAYDDYLKMQRENPEMFREVEKLMETVPDIPRGKVDWDTLEQIEEDPPEWQRFDAERDRLEEKYGTAEVYDAMDAIEGVKNVPKYDSRSATDLYYATAGEIEARDSEGRRTMNDAERAARFPFLGDGDTVFSGENGVKYSREMDALKALEQQNKLLKQQRDYWKGQTQQTKLKSADPAEVRRLARKIISQYSSQIKSTDILNELQELADREIRTDADLPFLSGEELTLARRIAEKVVQGAGVNVNAEQADTLKELKQFFRDARINVDATIKSDIADFADFKKNNRGLHFREDGSGRSMDSLWLELQDQFGTGYFPEDIKNPSDQIQHVADLMERMGEDIQNPYAGNMEMTITQMAYSLLNDVQKINTNKPTKVDKAIERTQQKLDALIAEGTTREKARVERASQTELRQRIRNISDKFERMALHPGKGATQHAPAGMLKSVVDFCQVMNASDMARQTRWTQQIEAKGEQLAEKLARENPRAADIQDYKKLERAAERNSKAIAKLQNLKAQYAAMKTDTQYQISYDEAVDNMLGGLLENLANSLVEGDIYELSSRELRDVYHTMTAMLYTVTNANKAFSMGKDKEISGIARKMAGEMRQVNHKAVGLKTTYQRYLQWQMSPDTFFNYLCGYIKGNEGQVIQKAFVNGEDKMLSVQREFYQTFAEFTETKDKAEAKELRELMNYNKKQLVGWGLKDQAGNEVKTSRGMMLQAYMMLEQGASIRSLAIGGFALPNAEQYYKGNVAAAYGDADDAAMVSAAVGTGYLEVVKELKQIRAEKENMAGVDAGVTGEEAAAQQQHALQALEARERELMDRGREIEEQGIRQVMTIKAEIEKQLTPQERRLIAKAHEWYARTGEMMQDVFEGMYGYRPYVVENYVPIHRDLSFVKTDIRDMAAAEKALNLENSGFTIERVKSVAPILLTDFFEELGRQKDQMSRYVGFAQVQKDFGKIWKFQVGSNGATISTMVRGRFGAGKTTFGVSGEEYINHYIADVAGGHKEDSIMSKFYGTYAAATLRFNPRVAVSQVASIPTAASVVGWGAMAKGVTKGLKHSMSTQYRNELAEKNAWFYQRYKGQGGSTELADLKNRGGVIERVANSNIGKHLFNWCQNFDVFATGSIMWEAAEAAVQQSGMSRDAEGYEAAVNEKYTEIIRKSQPNYTTTERADLLRDQRGGMKLLTMFKTQSSQNLNLLMEASGEFNRMKVDLREGRNGVTAADLKAAKTKLANAYTGVFLGGTAAFVAIRTLVNFIMGAVNPYRDKDTDEVTVEATAAGIGKEMLSSVAGMFAMGGPVYDVMMSIVTGDKYYGLTDTAIDSISTWLENSVKVIQNALDDEKEVTNTQIWNMVNGFCNMAGIPANNAKKLYDMVKMYYTDIQGGTFGQYTHDSTTNNNYRARIVEHYLEGNTKKADDAMAMLFAKSSKGSDEDIKKDIASGMRTYLKNEYIKSNITDTEAIRLMEYTGSDDPQSYVDKWDFQLAEPDVDNVSDKLVSAYNNRGNIDSQVFLKAYKFASSCQADKDKDGKSISGSKKQKVVDYIQNLSGLSKEQKKKLFLLLDVGSIKGTPWE